MVAVTLMEAESPRTRLARAGSGITLCRGLEEPARMTVSLFIRPAHRTSLPFQEEVPWTGKSLKSSIP